MKPHIHRDAIVAWAGGAIIQNRPRGAMDWTDCVHVPEWNSTHEYRVKPDYPASRMTTPELREAARIAVCVSPPFADHSAAVFRAVADASLRHACDADQVVRREEFDRAMAAREARDIAIAFAVRDAMYGAASCCLFGMSSDWSDKVKSNMDGIDLRAVIASVEVQS